MKLRQFFNFQQPDFLNLPEDVEPLLEKLATGNKKTHALAGYKRLVLSIQKFARQPRGQKLFMTRQPGQEQLSEHQFTREAERERNDFLRNLREMLAYLDVNKQFGQFTGERRNAAKNKSEFDSKYLVSKEAD